MDQIFVEFEEYKKYISKKPEKKRTSPSGIHLGIYKTLLLNDDLISISFKLISLALRHNLLLPLWLKTHQFLLQKDDKPYIHRIRYIIIIENDLQFIMTRWWAKDLQQHVDDNMLINEFEFEFSNYFNCCRRPVTEKAGQAACH